MSAMHQRTLRTWLPFKWGGIEMAISHLHLALKWLHNTYCPRNTFLSRMTSPSNFCCFIPSIHSMYSLVKGLRKEYDFNYQENHISQPPNCDPIQRCLGVGDTLPQNHLLVSLFLVL